jgi:hypothetical protein
MEQIYEILGDKGIVSIHHEGAKIGELVRIPAFMPYVRSLQPARHYYSYILRWYPRMRDTSLGARLVAAREALPVEDGDYICVICANHVGPHRMCAAQFRLGHVCNQCLQEVRYGIWGGGRVILLLRASGWLKDIREIIIGLFARL